MKKRTILIITICFAVVFIGSGLASEVGDFEIEELLKKGRTLSFKKFSETGGKDSGKRKARSDTWFSSDPEDLKPLVGTTWEFTFTVIDTFKRKITFGTDIEKDDEDDVYLVCLNQHSGEVTLVYYTELPTQAGGGYGFYAIFANDEFTQIYTFKIKGNEATGTLTAIPSSGMAEDFPITGIKTAPEIYCDSKDGGWLVTSDLWIRAVIETAEKGPVNAVFYKSSENTTGRGDTVISGHFYASPYDVSWGDSGNPDLYVKIWFDISGRIDVNFFHVSVPDIEVYSAYPYDGSYDNRDKATMDNRYVRHEFQR